MKKLIGLLLLPLLFSCTVAQKSQVENIPAAVPPPGIVLSSDDRLGGAGFTKLPGEARTYLKTLSEAFRKQDLPFLLAQGEAQFEAQVKPQYDEKTYLALLYRTGANAASAPRVDLQAPEQLIPAEIHHIEYEHWEEEGPLLDIAAKLVTKTGKPIPCTIMLVWRLSEPKILGLFP
jgi:hypothetical protein